MYFCYECEKTFIEPVELEESRGLDTPPYYRFKGCPHCYSESYGEQIGWCAECGEPIYYFDAHYVAGISLYCYNCCKLVEER